MPVLSTPSTPSPENPDPALFDQWIEDQGASPKNTAGRLVSPAAHPVEQVLRAWQKRRLGFGEARRRLGQILPLFGLDSEQEAGIREGYGSRLVVDCFPEKLRWQVRDVLIRKEAKTLSGEIPAASQDVRLAPSRRL